MPWSCFTLVCLPCHVGGWVRSVNTDAAAVWTSVFLCIVCGCNLQKHPQIQCQFKSNTKNQRHTYNVVSETPHTVFAHMQSPEHPLMHSTFNLGLKACCILAALLPHPQLENVLKKQIHTACFAAHHKPPACQFPVFTTFIFFIFPIQCYPLSHFYSYSDALFSSACSTVPCANGRLPFCIMNTLWTSGHSAALLSLQRQ